MGFRYLVLGAGMGEAVAHCLADIWDTSSILIGDINNDAGQRVAREISEKFPAVACEYVNFDANNPRSLKDVSPVNVGISALPAKYNLGLAKESIQLGMDFCDLGGVLPVTLAMKALDREAKKKNVSIVPECGLGPGMTNMVALKLVHDSLVHEPDPNIPRKVVMYVGGLPQKWTGDLDYQRMFYLKGLKSLCYDNAVIIKDGLIQTVAPLSEYETFRVDELVQFSAHSGGYGWVEAFITAGAGLAPWNFLDRSVISLCEKTVRWPGFAQFVQNTSPELFEEKIGPLIDIPIDVEHPDFVWMKVEVKYGEGKILTSTLLATYDPITRLSAMQQTTGFTTALIARAIALGKTKSGVLPPEEALFQASPENLNEVIKQAGTYFPITERKA